MSEMPAEIRRIADQIERWATYDDVVAPGLPDTVTLRKLAEVLDELARIVADSEVTNFNSDGDELSGCRWCDTLWGHEDGCPIQRIEQVLA